MSLPNVDLKYFKEAQPCALDLFSIPNYQTAIQNTFVQDCRPISQISGNSPIDFHVSGQNGLEYIDLKNSTLYVKCKIRKSDGTALSKDEFCSPVNLFLQSLWSQVDVSLQGKVINSSSNNYPYRAMINVLTESSPAEKEKLTSQLFYSDTANRFDSTTTTEGNEGLFSRHHITSGSKTFDMEGPIFCDMFQLSRYIINQVDIQVRLYRSKPTFCLMSPTKDVDYEVHLEDVVLRILKVSVNPGVIWGHNEALTSTPCKYPYTKTEIKMMAIPSGQSTFIWDNIFQSLRPTKVYIAFTSSAAVSGDFTKNPFNFAHFNLNQINLFCDGVSYGSGGPMKLSFDSKSGRCIIPMYANLLRTAGKWTDSDGTMISRNEVGGGYALYGFSLEPIFEGHENKSLYLNLQKTGNLRLEAQFAKPLPESVTCIIYAEFPGYFEIDKSRNVIV